MTNWVCYWFTGCLLQGVSLKILSKSNCYTIESAFFKTQYWFVSKDIYCLSKTPKMTHIYEVSDYIEKQ